MEDNQASITSMSIGNSSTIKIQNICFKWTKQQFEEEQFDLINVGTNLQAADMLTKPFALPIKWERALRLMSFGKSWIESDNGKVRQVASRPACAADANDQGAGGKESSTSFQRLLIEFYCSHESKLCTPREASKGCRRIRILNLKMVPPKAVVIGQPTKFKHSEKTILRAKFYVRFLAMRWR